MEPETAEPEEPDLAAIAEDLAAVEAGLDEMEPGAGPLDDAAPEAPAS